MENSNSHYVVGVDAGSRNTRVVQGSLDKRGKFAVLNSMESSSEGVRRGAVGDLNAFRSVVFDSISRLEKKGGIEVKDTCTVGVGSVSLSSVQRQASVNVPQERDVEAGDVGRVLDQVEEGLDVRNRAILGVYPFEYALDNQKGISDPVGMHGIHLEANATAVSVLASDLNGMNKALEGIQVGDLQFVAGPMAAAEAILTKEQRNNGVCVVDFGAETTGVAIYDEGFLQYVAAIPEGSHNITKDIATMLKVIPEVAEEVKLKYVSCNFVVADPEAVLDVKIGKENYSFKWVDVNETVEARLDEIFVKIRKHLQASGYDRRLAEGVMFVGGGANMRGLCDYARMKLELAARIGRPNPQLVVASEAQRKPEWATAIGAMMLDQTPSGLSYGSGDMKPKKKTKSGNGVLKKLFSFVK